MPEPPEHSTCTTVRGCPEAATHEITAGGKIRGLRARPTDAPLHLFSCERHLPIAAGYTRNREERKIAALPPVQPDLFDK
jgi:hypothetical protein